MGGDGRLSARAAKSDLTRLSGTDSSGSRFAPPQIGNEALHLSGTKPKARAMRGRRSGSGQEISQNQRGATAADNKN